MGRIRWNQYTSRISGRFLVLRMQGAQGTLPQIKRFPSRGLFSPGTQVFSHYPSDYFPGGWNESIPLELLGLKNVRPRGPTDFGGAWGKVISRFYEPKTAILKEANHVLHGNNNFLWFFY